MKRHFAVAALFLVSALGAQAIPKMFTAAVDNKWSTPGNWIPAGIPVAGDDLRLAPNADQTSVNDLAPGTVFAEIIVITPHVETITGNPLTVSYGVGSDGVPVNFQTDVTILNPVQGLGGFLHFTNLHLAAGSTINLGDYCTVSGSITGSGTINGEFGLTLTGSSSYAGTVTMGSLLAVDGAAPGITAVVSSNSYGPAALRGTGSLGNATISGILDPGFNPCNGEICNNGQYGDPRLAHTIGTLTVGALTLTGSASTAIDLNGAPGGGNDVISASSVSLAGALLVYPQLSIVPGAVFTIIDNRGASLINGIFTGAPEGARVNAVLPSTTAFNISYRGGNGNDVTLTARGHSTLSVSTPRTQTEPAETVPVTVHVAWDGTQPNPPGSVTMSFNGGPPQTLPLDAAGSATFNVMVAKGENTFIATYPDTGIYDGSSSGAELFGGKRQPVIAAVSRPDPAPLGQVFSLVVSLNDTSSPTGRITVSEGSTEIAEAALTDVIISVPMPVLRPGDRTLTVTYSGDAAHEPATATVTVHVSTFASALTYAKPPGSAPLTLDITVPGGNGPFPLILAIETDSWSIQPRSSLAALREATRGWAVAVARIRPSFPGQIQDLKAALRWLRASAAQYDLQPNRFVAWGIGPAGGQLAALLGTSGNVTALDDPNGSYLALSARVQGVIDWSGADDLASFGSCANSLASNARLLGSAAVPAAYASEDDPPFLLMHGNDDCAVAPAAPASLANALRAVSVDATLLTIAGAAATGSGWGSADVMKAVDDFLDVKVRPPTSRRRAAGRP